MERSCKQVDEGDFNLKEWAVRARRISRENTNISRRFSASNFREEARSFRSNAAVSSTASSPGYTARDEFDPSTYSFTTALKALQAKTVYTWEFQSPDGLTLNSKWNEAEKYICNPLSGEVPLECLSAKTLSGRSFRGLTNRITMSAPLIYPSQMHHFHAKSPINEHEHEHDITSNEKKKSGTTRDVGTQSTPVELSSSSPTPAPTPSIEERSIKGVDMDSSLKSDESEVEVKERRERDGGEREMMSRCSNSQGGCLSLRGLWMRTLKQRDKHKPRTNMLSTFLHHLNACSKQ